jgi:ABC-type nitrate/sulfonate/bicarbonate transport system substrate-binding protein
MSALQRNHNHLGRKRHDAAILWPRDQSASEVACFRGNACDSHLLIGGGPLNVAAETQPITVAVTPDAAGLDAYTAQQKGYFKSAGLDVTIKFVTDISLLPPVINAGQYEVGNIVPTIILRAAAQGIPLTAICGDHVSTRQKPSFTIVTLSSSEIKSLTDLKDHIVGSPAVGGGFSISMLYYLKSHGVDPKSVQQIQSTGASLPGLLDNHRVDAILSQSPYNLKVQGPKYRDLGSPLIVFRQPFTWRSRVGLQTIERRWSRFAPR